MKLWYFVILKYRLTAFVAKSFAQASEAEKDTNVKIVPDVVEKAVRYMYLVENQQKDGYYLENGRVSHKRMQVNAQTCLVTMIVCEAPMFNDATETHVNAGLKRKVQYLASVDIKLHPLPFGCYL